MTTSSITAPLRGDVCPPWCDGEHRDERTEPGGRAIHPDDAAREHSSAPLDTWHPTDSEGRVSRRPMSVVVRGWRYDNHDDDGEDLVVARDDCGSSFELPASDARRLGEALVRAADLMKDTQ